MAKPAIHRSRGFGRGSCGRPGEQQLGDCRGCHQTKGPLQISEQIVLHFYRQYELALGTLNARPNRLHAGCALQVGDDQRQGETVVSFAADGLDCRGANALFGGQQLSACSGRRCAFFMRPNCTRGCDNDSQTPLFLNNPCFQVRFCDLECPSRMIRLKRTRKKCRHCRGCAIGCHTLCAMMSVDSGMLHYLAGPCWKGNSYKRSSGTGC